MAQIKPFCGIRPRRDLAERIAALPYDVYSRGEARKEVEREPLSFLKVDRAETQFPPGTDIYEACVYEKARDTLAQMLREGEFVRDDAACYYLYEQNMAGHRQTGIVGCASISAILISAVCRRARSSWPIGLTRLLKLWWRKRKRRNRRRLFVLPTVWGIGYG